MAATMGCRGPDDGGLWLARNVALGHRRLAVIDVEDGRQPMAVDDLAVTSYSGEIYNFRELRAGLAGRAPCG
jgi:asparagine synthase (glutamine-hydrolysing)